MTSGLPPMTKDAVSWPGGELHLAQLAKRGLDGAGIRIAVIDTGVARSQGKLAWARIEIADVRGGNGDDLNGHGTCMVGILASDIGITQATVRSIRALDSEGNGTASDLVAAIDDAIAARCDVLSISAGQSDSDHELDAAVDRASRAGAIVVGAIRKENPQASAYPARSPGAIAVTPSKRDDHLCYPDPPSWVCVGAPGVDIGTYSRTEAVTIAGSSPTTAIVAGICARLLGARTGAARSVLAGRLNDILHSTGKAIDGGRLLQALAAADQLEEN